MNDIFNYISLIENIWIPIKISLMNVRSGTCVAPMGSALTVQDHFLATVNPTRVVAIVTTRA